MVEARYDYYTEDPRGELIITEDGDMKRGIMSFTGQTKGYKLHRCNGG